MEVGEEYMKVQEETVLLRSSVTKVQVQDSWS